MVEFRIIDDRCRIIDVEFYVSKNITKSVLSEKTHLKEVLSM